MTHKSECFVSAPISNGNPSFHTGTLAEYILVKFDVENETRFNCNRHTPESPLVLSAASTRVADSSMWCFSSKVAHFYHFFPAEFQQGERDEEEFVFRIICRLKHVSWFPLFRELA